jgi:hypothetical protein
VLKTNPTSSSVEDFINSISGEQKRKDSQIILTMMEKAMKEKPKMRGSSIGFGNVRYKSPATAREIDWFKIGFSPRKANLSLYLMDLQRHAEALTKLRKHKTGAGCLYTNKLEDVDVKILEKMISATANPA